MNAITKKVLFHFIAVAGVAAGSIGIASAEDWRPAIDRDFHGDRYGRFERGDHFSDRRLDRGYGRFDGSMRDARAGFRAPLERFREPVAGLKR